MHVAGNLCSVSAKLSLDKLCKSMQAYRVLKQKKEQDDYLIYISLGSTPDSKTKPFISRPFVVNFAVMFSNGSKGLGNWSLTALSLAVVPSRRPKGTAQKKY